MTLFPQLIKKFICLFFITGTLFSSVKKQILLSNANKLIIELSINLKTESDVFPTSLLIGLPDNKLPKTTITYNNETPAPFLSSQDFNKGFEWTNRQLIQNLHTGTLTISPMKTINSYYKDIIIEIEFDYYKKNYRIANKSEIALLKNRIQNWNIAKSWINKNKKRNNNINRMENGRWFQFFLDNDGMASITYSSLESIISDIANIEPKSFSIFMNYNLGRSKTQEFNIPMNDNMKEIAIQVVGEDDGSFNQDDKIIFYGRGPSGFDISDLSLEWHQNLYFTTNSCWLFIPDNPNSRGKRITISEKPQSGILIDYGLVKNHIETDLINLQASGTEWLSTPIQSGGSLPVLLNVANPKPGGSVSIFARFRGHSVSESSTSNHLLNFRYGSIDGQQIGSNLSWTGTSSKLFSENNINLTLINGTNLFYIKNISENANSYPYLDYFNIEYNKILDYNSEFEFTSPIIGENIRFDFSGEAPDNTSIWDISDIENPKTVEIENEGFFNYSTYESILTSFVVFNTENISEISDLYFIENIDLYSLRQTNIQADYIIIGPENFKNASQELLNVRGPSVYASLEKIYLQFAGGNKDPMAIRSFIQWTQESWSSPQPTCVLLLGDSGYDYRNITGQSTIIVPTIQVQSYRTYASDDLLVALNGNIPEVATGRYPARNETEVLDFIEKIIEIETNPKFGPWRQKVTLVADDAARPEPNHGSISTGKSHTLNSEQLSEIIPNSIFTEKIYMIEYPEVSNESAYGVIKPKATEDLLNALSSGMAILSYIGHGSPYQLAQEKLLEIDRGDLNRINTGKKLPIWIVGTCSFGHFDDPLTESFAEELIRQPMNAASAVIATSRPITVTGNERYTLDIFESIFDNNNISDNKIGIILQSIKDGSSEAQYFHLFGDPAMLLPMPTDTLTNLVVTPDTLKTLEIGSYSGTQNLITSGNGYVALMDANQNVTREYEIASETHSISYQLPGATLFRGQFSFSNNLFNGSLRIPQDISYSNNFASLIIYIHDEEKEGRASINNIYLAGGISTEDKFGPQITFENLAGRRFESGDHFPINNQLVMRFSDPLGINLTNETGHEIIVNNLNEFNFTVVTDDFLYDQNSITTGTIIYPINDKSINFMVKAWDNANNPTEKEINLFRTANDNLKLYNTYNFPNPFISKTQFIFEITQDANVRLDIYTIGGKKIWTQEKTNLQAGIQTINWDGLDSYDGKIANGVYLYKLKATGNNTSVSYIGRCAKYN